MALLKNRNFLLLRAGWSISALGTQLQAFAFSLYILRVTGSAMQFAVTLCLQIVPTLLMAPFSGYLADRWDRRLQVVLFDLLSGGVTLGFWMLYLGWGRLPVPAVYVCVFLLAALEQFNSAAAGGLMQQAVPKEDITAQQTVAAVLSNLTSVGAPALGGILFGISGLSAAFACNAASFFACAVLESRIRLRSRVASGPAAPFDLRAFGSAQREAVSYIRHSPFLQSFLTIGAALNFIVVGADVGLMVAAQKHYGMSAAWLGAANSAVALGVIAGVLLASALAGRVERMGLSRMFAATTVFVAAAFVGSGALLFWGAGALPTAVDFWLFVSLNAVVAGCCGFDSVHLSSEFMKRVDPQIIGRTGAFTSAALVSATPLGQVAAGALLSAFPYGVTYFFESALSGVALLFMEIRRGRSAPGTAESAIIEHAPLLPHAVSGPERETGA